MTGSRSASSLLVSVFALLFIANPAVVWSRFTDLVAGGTEAAGSRSLLQTSVNQCPYDFSKVDFSSITSVCKGPNYSTSACCAPFTALACKYKPQINDFNSLCPIYFISYLDVAGGYPAGVFVGQNRCNNGNMLCSS